MPAVRQLLALALVALLGCRPAGITLSPAPALDRLTPVSTLFLIGDAGAAAKGGDRVLTELARQGRAATRASAIVFLGDNVYPAGIPPAGDPDRPEAERRLLALASLADSTGLPVYLIPGNHDWARHRPDGWAAVQRAERLLERYAAEREVRVRQVPSGGCPGPEAVELAGFRVVAIDTQWWLHDGPRPGDEQGARGSLPDPEVRCDAETPAAVTASLATALGAPGGEPVVVIGHHPMESHGEHGGYHPLTQWLLPLAPTPFAPWLWLPIGWIYPVGRHLVADAQDQWSDRNRQMRSALEGSFPAGGPLIYAAGHEHALEVIRRGAGRYYLVSGAGMEHHQTAVGMGDSTAFRSSRPGFMRLDRFADRRVRLGVTVLDPSNQAREAYRSWLDYGTD
ncbi:MAG: metallophosphoesterase [Gemmatimonadales bacterium]